MINEEQCIVGVSELMLQYVISIHVLSYLLYDTPMICFAVFCVSAHSQEESFSKHHDIEKTHHDIAYILSSLHLHPTQTFVCCKRLSSTSHGLGLLEPTEYCNRSNLCAHVKASTARQ